MTTPSYPDEPEHDDLAPFDDDFEAEEDIDLPAPERPSRPVTLIISRPSDGWRQR